MVLDSTLAPLPAPGIRPVHRLAEGTELIGEYRGSGFQEPRYLIRRSDGQVMQLPALLYRVAGSLDGRRDDGELAAELDQDLTAEEFSFLVEEKLRPAGIIAADDEPDAAEPVAPVKSDPLLALRYRVGVVPAGVVFRLAGVLPALFWRPVWVAALLGLVAVDVAILAQGDLLGRMVGGVEAVIHQPALLLLLIAVELLAATFHEIGHVTACRYGGARPGNMGIGLYIVWPAFYSTVTDSYRLDRVGRLRTDLGGVYFNAVFLVGMGLLYLQTGTPWMLLALIALHSGTLWQFLPSIRLDGYYILADLVGVPDLFSYVVPALKSLVPGRPVHPRVRALRPWPRRIMVGWVAAVVPTLLFYLVVFLVAVPKVLPVVWREVQLFLHTLETSVRSGQVVSSTLGVFQLFLLLLPTVGTVLITVTTVGMLRRAAVARWGRGRCRPGTWARLRGYAALAGVGGLGAALVLRTWEVGTSLPATADELRWTNEAFSALQSGSVADAAGTADALAGLQVAGYAWLTGAFGRHPTVLDGSRELAVLATAVLVVCLLVFAARRRVRPMAVALPLGAAVVMGPVVSAMAGVSAALLGAAWAAAGLLVLTRHRAPQSAVTVVGVIAVGIGVATSPLVLLPLATGAAVLLARGSVWSAQPASWRWGAVGLLLVGAGFVAWWNGGRGPSVEGGDRAILLAVGALTAVGGGAVHRLRPWARLRAWAAAAAAVVVVAVLSGADGGAALPLVVVTVVPLGVLVVDALVGVPVAERPHPLLRAVLVVPVLVVTAVGGLFMPASTPASPHADLAAWITAPAAPSTPLSVPAVVWGDLLRDGVPPDRIRLDESGDPSPDQWAVVSGRTSSDPRAVAHFGSGAGALTVLEPADRRTAEEGGG
jgi:putative peptide zinc metalloprotease protein